MCDPLTIAATSFAVSAASSIVGFMGQQKAFKANEQAAQVTADNAFNTQQDRNTQIDANQSENVANSAINAAQARGRISSSASAYGLDASTAAGEVQASNFETGREASIDALNAQNQRTQSGATVRGIEINRVADINRVQQPGAASLVVGLGKDAVGAANTYANVGGRF